MNLYSFYSKPDRLFGFDRAYAEVPAVFWDNYEASLPDLKKRESAIAKDPHYSYQYAMRILEGPFPLGEKTIATHKDYAYLYALFILKGPFTLGEPVIAQDGYNSLIYAREILKGPFPMGVPAMKKAKTNEDYDNDMGDEDEDEDEDEYGESNHPHYDTGTCFGDYEAFLKKAKLQPTKPKKQVPVNNALRERSAFSVYTSVKHTIENLKPYEQILATDPWIAFEYAYHVLEGTFPLAEPTIAKDSGWAFHYAKDVLKGPFPMGEPAIATDGYRSLIYARETLKGPFPAGEKAISADPKHQAAYEQFLATLK